MCKGSLSEILAGVPALNWVRGSLADGGVFAAAMIVGFDLIKNHVNDSSKNKVLSSSLV